MWTILRNKAQLTITFCAISLAAESALAQQATVNNNQNFGFNLPTPVMPHGFDEVRASDGTTCRSSVASSGPYLDVGGLSGQDYKGDSSGATVYGRIVVPLGKKPQRLNCASLYQLEIERLRHELRLARSGLGMTGAHVNGQWAKTGWNNNAPRQ
ncbi:MAG: hypothetical protein JJ891_12020 [Rhizobiaceae bacterium]|nr:hypothetical protein [Rhizobiaceae bacterium]